MENLIKGLNYRINILSFLAISAWFTIVLNGCGGDTPTDNTDTNNPTSTADFFPMGTGSWWKYKVSVDPTSNIYKIDSTVLVSKKLLNGKDSYMFITYLMDKDTYEITSIDTSYYYKEGPQIFKFETDYSTNEKKWLLYANLQLEYVKIFEFPIEEDFGDAILTGVERLERIVEGPEKVYLGDETINCIKTKVNLTWEGTLKYPDGSTEPYNDVFYTEHQWFGYNVGYVKVYWPNDEYDKSLLDYNIVKEE